MGLFAGFLPAQTTFTQWAKTPPMGWNSWDCYGPTVEEHEVKANADYMAEHLKQYGWEYIVVDIRWFVENDKAGGYNQTDPRYVMDEYGRYLPAVNRFPSASGNKGFKPLADYIHSKGLKFGIHIMRGVPRQAVEKKLPIKGTNYTADQIYSTDLQCEWLRDNYTIADKPGAQEYYNSIMELYASWGVDFIKVDDLSRPYHKREIEMIRQAIDHCNRPIVLSISPGKTPIDEAVHASVHSNMWRMVDDVWDIWEDVTHLMRVAQDWYPYISPTWPDCDMIPFGRISIRGERGKDRMTRLTKDEQYSLMTFFTIFRSPLMFGGDLPSNDAFTLSLLTNSEVLRMHRESTDVRQLFQQDGKVAVTSRNPLTGEHYLALFNISDLQKPAEIRVNLKDVGINNKYTIKNLWTGESPDFSGETFSVTLQPHACGLYALKPEYSNYPIQPVTLNHIELTDNFWLPKIRIIQEKTIRYAFDKCESEGRLENFKMAGDIWRVRMGALHTAPSHIRTFGKMPFDDTDVYKSIEGAAYSLINAPNPQLDGYLDSIIGIIAYGQEPDGYLTTWRTIDLKHPTADWVKTNGERWNGLDMSHELYNSGHLFEAASAHFLATGKRNFLNIALKNADLLVKVFGDRTNYEVPGHQIVETGLIKLYQITGKREYLHLAKKFLDLRGDATHRKIRGPYSQDHLPVTLQDEVVGHAVRAMYMYAGMTDIAALYSDSTYFDAINKLWNNMTGKKMYITGGLGARHSGEAFGDNYELPNLTAYSETCAAIGGVYWNERLFRLTGKTKYIDLLERMLYNAVIAGISFKGTEFFYPNPLESDGLYKFNQGSCTRQAWFDCSCCPTNLIRFLPYVPNLIYATQGNTLYVNLFVSNKANIPLGKENVLIEQQTDYPRNGNVKISIKPEKSQPFTLKIRIPSWVQNIPAEGGLYHYTDKQAGVYRILVNGKPQAQKTDKDGYVEITRTWRAGDKLELQFPMQVRKVETDANVKDDAGKYAVEYGPLVYCMEEVDNQTFASPQSFTVEWRPDLLSGVNVIRSQECMLIPYYAWSNRGIGKMKVFFEK
jgi:DUF1680 family protein